MIMARLSTAQHTSRYSKPENIGSPERFCATPTVNGLRTAPAKPTCAATYTMHTPTIES